jgi:aminoglycoside phosphotransferase (APT) family kinase protein
VRSSRSLRGQEEDGVAGFSAYLSAAASRYFPELRSTSTRVVLLRRVPRPESILYHYSIEDGTHSHRVIVKEVRPANRPDPEIAFERPRLNPPAPTDEDKARREFESLARIHDHFTRLGDNRFGAVRVLDHLCDRQALVMEAVEGSSLRRLVYRSAFPGGNDKELIKGSMHNAGIWLRLYHSMPPAPSTIARHTTRAEYIEFVVAATRFLSRHTGDEKFFGLIRDRLENVCQDLPESLPLGVGHGDFALRNVLVTPEGRIAVIDTRARYQVPIYQDIGYFLVSLRHNWAQIATRGALFERGFLDAMEQEFLAGYFGQDAIPRMAVLLFEVQAMLDIWGEVVTRQTRRGNMRGRIIRGIRRALISAYYRGMIGEFLAGGGQASRSRPGPFAPTRTAS